MYAKYRVTGILVVLALSAVLSACRSNDPIGMTSMPVQTTDLAKHGMPAATQVNLVADLGSFSPKKIDGNLLNAWGIAVSPNGKIWISANHSSLSVIYDQDGAIQRSPVTIPTKDSSGGGAPTGVIFNPTSGFVIPGTGEVSKFIFASEDGIISAWSSGPSAIVVVDRSSADAVYKGIALASEGGHQFIYATNFKGGMVDVFDEHFTYISTMPFHDPGIPSGFAPFNIQNIDGRLFVTYAKQKGPDNQDDQSGPGNGYVDIYNPNGSFVQRFASQGALNSPWGLATVPEEGSGRLEHAILVGNFGDGRVSIFDKQGKFLGQLSNGQGQPLTIAGLWALAFISPAPEGHDGKHGDHHGMIALGEHQGDAIQQRLFFTAGPHDENDGLFGYLQVAK
jgi:uncharacterized protein (TIGR03118 family)